jgi:hypothetical protein
MRVLQPVAAACGRLKLHGMMQGVLPWTGLVLVGSPTEGDVNGDLTSSPSPEGAENHLSMARSARIMCELRHTSAEFFAGWPYLRKFGEAATEHGPEVLDHLGDLLGL